MSASPLPSIQTLRAFDAAARHGSYSAAADELGVTHGAVSHRIRELEERLGVSLFRRVGRTMAPTREAVALLSQVRQALASLGRAFPGPAERASSPVVVSLHPSLANCWLIPNLSSFQAACPGVELDVRSTADLEDFLDPGVDVALRYGGGDWPHAAVRRLGGEVLFPVCAPGYRDTLDLREPADLERCTLLRHAWQPWAPWFREARLRLAEPMQGLSFSDNAMALEAAAAGLGVCLARELLARRDLASGQLVRLFEVELPDVYGYFLAWRPGARLTPAIEALGGWVSRELRPGPT